METDDINFVPELKRAHQKRLKLLEVKAAEYGMNCPSEIQLEIDEIKKKLNALSQSSVTDSLKTENAKIPSISLTSKPIALLYISTGINPGTCYFITEEHRSIIIGRASSCDIQLSHVTVARSHCEIQITPVDGRTLKQRDYKIEILDLNSSNGLFLNRLRVKREVLNNGDNIQIGPFSITFYRISE